MWNQRSNGTPAVLPAVMVSVVEPDVFTVPGMEQVTFVSGLATEHVKVTVPLNLFCAVMLTVAVPELPRKTVREVGEVEENVIVI